MLAAKRIMPLRMVASMLPALVAWHAEMESRQAELVKFMVYYMPEADAWRYAQEASESMDLTLAIRAASAGCPFHLVLRR